MRIVDGLRADPLPEPAPSLELIGQSAPMRALRDVVERVAATDSTVLVSGETGTGKELVARSLHEGGRRRTGPFVALNCAAVPEHLLESELFGHARGAFTGAVEARVGLLRRADGGTLFLDEIADLPRGLQPKLLRALQERAVRPVGGGGEVPFDARVIAASNVDLSAAVKQGAFRADLFFRLDVVHIRVPRLAERGGDVLLLARYFAGRCGARAGKRIVGFEPEVAGRLAAYEWPGNVRELQNCLEHAVALARREHLTVDDLPDKLRRGDCRAPALMAWPDELVTVRDLERSYIAHVLGAVGGNKRRAARVLGFDRATLYRKMARYGIDVEADREAGG